MEQKFNTVDEVVEDIISELTLAERVVAADLDETEFRVLELALGNYIQYRLDKMDATVNNVRLSNIIDNLIQKLRAFFRIIKKKIGGGGSGLPLFSGRKKV